MDSRLNLKIKLKTLAAEARIIRKEELKFALPGGVSPCGNGSSQEVKAVAVEARLERRRRRAAIRNAPWYAENVARRESLRDHRLNVVRLEARATHLAYGFIRGLEYGQMERKAHPLAFSVEKALWSKVYTMVRKNGSRELLAAGKTAVVERLNTWAAGRVLWIGIAPEEPASQVVVG